MQNLIEAVIFTLGEVEVKGKDNLNKLLGSINALESVLQIMAATPVPPEALKEESNG